MPASTLSRQSHARFSTPLTLALAALLAGCAVGPDFTPPPAPDAPTYGAQTPPCVTADGAQILQPGADIPAAWWDLFRSPALTRLVTQAVKNNPDLQAADAALRVAQDDLSAGDGALFPTVSASYAGQREKTSGAANNNLFPGFIYSLHNASVSVSYGVDIFGGTRRAIEELQAQTDYAQFEQRAAWLSLTGNVVTTAIDEASLRDQIAATTASIADQEKVLNLLQKRFAAGAVAQSAVAQQQATLAASQAALPPLQHQLAVARHALATLAGRLPSQGAGESFTLADLHLPRQIPLSLPSQLVAQRPDIRAAQENLHAASAAIGVAVAARLPDVTLTADIGTMATQFGKLFTPGSGLWDWGGSVSETIFDAGTLADKEQGARDAYIEAAAQYRKTVLAAYQDVADTLHALQSDAELLKDRAAAERAAATSLTLAKVQFTAGAIAASDLMTAEATENTARADLVAAQAQRYADTAALFVALGGGWWHDAAHAATGTIASNTPQTDESTKGPDHD
ncbi:MAG: efflux transporter outer membrane subunit [Alphaproteobacteria bacterium]|nr:efflux transporter outer membrane subunit [Alphaproteobacteria bacterium]